MRNWLRKSLLMLNKPTASVDTRSHKWFRMTKMCMASKALLQCDSNVVVLLFNWHRAHHQAEAEVLGEPLPIVRLRG
jgi:hypothetical protein